MIKEARTYVRKGQDPSKVRAYGEGLERAIVGELAKFQVDTQVRRGIESVVAEEYETNKGWKI